jgi:putative FmdB family regulatory protein
MALYDYECIVCGAVHEVEHGMNETPAVTCSCSEGASCKRLISCSNFMLMGSGWAKDGYESRKENSKKENG